jgi:hypothetical protein
MGGAKRAGNPRADDYRAAGRQQQERFDRAGQELSCRFALTLRRRAGASAERKPGSKRRGADRQARRTNHAGFKSIPSAIRIPIKNRNAVLLKLVTRA